MATKKKTNSCLIGCGIGCLILLAVAIALFAGGAVWFRGMVGGFEEAVETREAVEEEFGGPDEFTPAADGSIAPDRVEAFLAIRAATADSRAGIRATFEALPMGEEQARELEEKPFFEQMSAVFGITGSALGLAGRLGDFYQARNTAFLEREMGLGEYSYIYVLAYYNWLGKSPADGPGGEDEQGDFQDSFSRLRRDLISQLENQLQALEPGPGATAEAAPGDPRRAALEAEIQKMRKKPFRVPWEDELPPAIERSLAPFRDRFEAAYDPVTNPFELSRMEKGGNNFSFQAN